MNINKSITVGYREIQVKLVELLFITNKSLINCFLDFNASLPTNYMVQYDHTHILNTEFKDKIIIYCLREKNINFNSIHH